MRSNRLAHRWYRRPWLLFGLLCSLGFCVAAVATRRYLMAGYDVLCLDRRYAEFRIDDVPMSATVVAFVAHPDDACFIFSGTLARLIQERHAKVTLVSLKASRMDEFEAAGQRLDAVGVRTVDSPPDDPNHYRPQLDAQIAGVLTELNPKVVLSFGPEGITGHPDHQAVGESVWRSVSRRGGGIVLLRAVMPREFAGFVPRYAACNEPGWGVGPLLRVPLGEVGTLRSKLADCYASQRTVLAQCEGYANFINTEFYVASRHDEPAFEPELNDSLTAPTIIAAEALLIVHPVATWDLRQQAKPCIENLASSFTAADRPVIALTNPEYPFVYLSPSRPIRAFSSPGGEHLSARHGHPAARLQEHVRASERPSARAVDSPPSGFGAGSAPELVLQGVIEDAGSANSTGFSVTNAVFLYPR